MQRTLKMQRTHLVVCKLFDDKRDRQSDYSKFKETIEDNFEFCQVNDFCWLVKCDENSDDLRYAIEITHGAGKVLESDDVRIVIELDGNHSSIGGKQQESRISNWMCEV